MMMMMLIMMMMMMSMRMMKMMMMTMIVMMMMMMMMIHNVPVPGNTLISPETRRTFSFAHRVWEGSVEASLWTGE